jgi:hypothetical protein
MDFDSDLAHKLLEYCLTQSTCSFLPYFKAGDFA